MSKQEGLARDLQAMQIAIEVDNADVMEACLKAWPTVYAVVEPHLNSASTDSDKKEILKGALLQLFEHTLNELKALQ